MREKFSAHVQTDTEAHLAS